MTNTKKDSEIKWPAHWDPSEGWPKSIPGVSDAAMAKCVEALGGPKAPSGKEGGVMSTSKKPVDDGALMTLIRSERNWL